ncbi:hybrid sensor histidine kinase/response regulator [Paracoccus beibuensis]|uniref:hybrid sensor histidine kinase/response regulator n=1 Tax=Paracoccus beibuensis TaxID=547602 RepID=UPI002240602A|nr:PAS domain S-box protein [Paracoccus beibuensis]
MNDVIDRNAFVHAPGEAPRLVAAFDWSKTPLGDIAHWPVAVRAVVGTMLRSPLPIVTLWGEEGVMIYNDGYAQVAGSRHPEVMGANVREAWPEVAEFNDGIIEAVLGRGETVSLKDQELILHRGAAPAPAWLNLDYSPILGDDGTPLGVIAMVVETTVRVLTDRQLQDDRQRLQQMHEKSPSLMAMLEGPEHRFVLVNPAFNQVIGQRDVLGRTVAEALPDAVQQGYLDHLNRVFASGEAVRMNGAVYDVSVEPTGAVQRRYLDFVYQPMTDAQRKVTGIFVTGIDVTERIAAQTAIKEQHAQFRTFAQAMPNHVWTAPPDGQSDWFNDRMIDYTGRDFDQLLDDGWLAVAHPDDRETAALNWAEAIRSGRHYEAEFRIRRADGAYRWHLVRALPIRHELGYITRWIGTNTDIHEQKLAEAQSTQDRDRLWNLSQEMMLVCDSAGLITAINPSAERLLGWSQSEMLRKPLLDFLHPDDIAATLAELEGLSRGEPTLAFENRYRCRDGSYCLLDWTAVPDGGRIHAVGRDITRERRLARERERIWTLSPVLQIIAEHSGRIAAVNPAWTDLLGWTQAETVGRTALEFIRPEDQEELGAALRALLGTSSDGVPAHPLQATLVARNGEHRHVEWTTVFDSETIFAFGRDITGERETAAALASSEAALRQAQKMEAIGQLTGGIAHDFNNLLQVIGGSLQLLAGNAANDDKARRRIQIAMEGVARGSRLASQLLAFGRRQPLAPKVVNLGRLIPDLDEMLHHAVGEAVQVDTAIADDLWNTLIDRGNLENALLNLAINARDAMEGHGKLSIRADNAHLEGLRIGDYPEAVSGQYVMLSVTDTGSGIHPEILHKVFDPFFSTKPEGRGSGLGLSMVYGFVRQSGGHVGIDSKVGVGTTITLYLPRVQRPEDEIDSRDFGPITGGTETILVAEDDQGVRETVVETLRDLGYNVLQASDAQGALAILESGVHVDLLFTDVVMPGPMKSTELARLAEARMPDLKVLFTSGYAENSIVHAGRLDEGVELLSKPYGREDLARKIRHQFANSAQRRASPPQSPQPEAAPAPEPATSSAPGLCILVCEDDVLIRISVVDMLKDLGHNVLQAGRATTALDLLSRHKVDLLLTDVGLPDMQGDELARQARDRNPTLPLIFATGHSEVPGFKPDGRTRLLSKPFDDIALAAAIEALDVTRG